MAEKFYLPTHKDAVLISGGIGVTPFLGLLYGKNNPSQKVWCYYCCSTKKEAVFDPELKHIATKLPSLEYHLQVSETDGRLSTEQLSKQIPDFKQKLYFICGPKPMMDGMSQQLMLAGISQKNIVMEDFNFIS
jgi:predicted ferric reductase